MPFSDLDPKSQQFLGRYFKSAIPFIREGTSQTDKDRMADEYKAWLAARAAFVLKLQAYPPYVGTANVITALDQLNDMVEKDQTALNAVRATQELAKLGTALDGLGRQYVDNRTFAANAALTRMKAMTGVVLHRAKADQKFADLQAAGARTPPDFDGVRAAHDFILAEEPKLKAVSDAYLADYNNIKGWVTASRNRYPEIADPFVAADKAAIEAKLVEAEQKLEEHSIVTARTLIKQAYAGITTAARIAKDNTDYLADKAAADVEIDKLIAKRNPGVEEECAAIEKARAAAATAAAARDFGTATRVMADLKARALAGLPVADGYLAFEAAAQTASDAISALAAHPQGAFAAGEISEARSIFGQAETLAGARSYGQAVARLGLIPDLCTAGAAKASGASDFTRLEASVAKEDPARVVMEAARLVKNLEAHPRAAEIGEALSDLRARLKAADAGVENFDDDEARAHLKELAELASGARRLADVIDVLLTRSEAIEARIAALRDTHGQAKYVAPKLKEASDALPKAKDAARKADDAATGFLDQAETHYDTARKLADAQENYLIRKGEVKTIADDGLKLDFPDKDAAKTRINDTFRRAEDLSKALEPVKARGALEVIVNEVTAAKLAARAKGGTAPTKQEILDLIAQPDGQRMLDRLVEALPGDVRQDVMLGILSARFDMDTKLFETEADHDAETEKTVVAGPAPDLLGYYKMLTRIPDTHTKLNESLLRFDEVEDENRGSYYDDTVGKVVMGVGATMNAPGNAVGDPGQLDDIEPDCVCRPDSEVAMPTYGTWTTLHEIGHAVDDAKRFMKGVAGNSAYGGWTEYGGNTAPIAVEVAKAFDYDRYFIERTIAGGAPEDPAVPDDLQKALGDGAAAEWAARRQKVLDWYAAMRSTADPWESAATCAQWKIGSKVYHEAYPDTWVSYDLAARRQGVTGYQFRAPGEWFSELYAAYHTGKLNPKHPAVKWLSAL